MSSKTIKDFNAWLLTNDDARAKVEGYGSDIKKIVTFANESGFDIHLDQIVSEDIELDIDTLEDISGGTRAGMIGQIVSTVGIAFIISENN